MLSRATGIADHILPLGDLLDMSHHNFVAFGNWLSETDKEVMEKEEETTSTNEIAELRKMRRD